MTKIVPLRVMKTVQKAFSYHFVLLLMHCSICAFAQNPQQQTPSNIPKNWGANDSIFTSTIFFDNEWVPFKEMDNVWVSNLSQKKLDQYIAQWTRLRNAVYVTYPFAKVAGNTINDINLRLTNVTDRKQRKAYIKSREKELRKQFTEPISNLSVYQGKVLMKLINRQTGNNCYDILKEYKGGVNARLYQTVAFFVGGNLKQNWDLTDNTDKLIEGFVMEIERKWQGYN